MPGVAPKRKIVRRVYCKTTGSREFNSHRRLLNKPKQKVVIMAQKKRGEMVEQTEVRVPFEHLSPAAQAVIGAPGSFRTIKNARLFRGLSELAIPIGATMTGAAMPFSLGAGELIGLAVGTVPVGLAFRANYVKQIQQAHEELKRAINRHGVLHTSFEGHYPFNWMNSTQVARTHPIFYVTGRGDIVFKKNTRLEYMRYLDQMRWYGKKGFTPWRWRVYLEPPTAPAKVRTAVLAKLKVAWAERSTELQPAHVPVRFRKRT